MEPCIYVLSPADDTPQTTFFVELTPVKVRSEFFDTFRRPLLLDETAARAQNVPRFRFERVRDFSIVAWLRPELVLHSRYQRSQNFVVRPIIERNREHSTAADYEVCFAV
jgi:hypothetical protein